MSKNSYQFYISLTILLLAYQVALFGFDLSKVFVTIIGYGALCMLTRFYKISAQTIGIGVPSKKAWKWAAGTMLVIGATLFAAYSFDQSIFLDTRYDQSLSQLYLAIFLTLPFLTVLFEELVFRGLLLGKLVQSFSTNKALLLSAFAFGLWHIPSSFAVTVDSFLFVQQPSQLLVTLAVVATTTGAGWVFGWLRLKSGNLLVPLVAHWSFNAFSMILAWLAWN